MLEHGGKVGAAAARYGIPREEWVDLSTGLNPRGWPVPSLPGHLWGGLPEGDGGLEEAARCAYGASVPPLVVAGEQAALQALPRLRPPGVVGVVSPTYAEHPHAWRRGGHRVVELAPGEVAGALPELSVLVVVNPNNPTGWHWPAATLLGWREALAARGGWLVVDEAFMDVEPAASLAPHLPLPGLVVLRSLGKFFGLAGARVGFVLAGEELLTPLEEELGPWPVSGPSRWMARCALEDRAWQEAARRTLPEAARRLAGELAAHGLPPRGGCALFQWVPHPDAPLLQEGLARQGVLVRRFSDPAALRFGLPGSAGAWERLRAALATLPASRRPEGGG